MEKGINEVTKDETIENGNEEATFENDSRALNGEEAEFGVFTPIDPEDLAWGVVEVLYNDPPDQEAGTAEFSHEVARYAGLVLYNNGIFTPPKFLSFAEYPKENPVLDLETAFTDDVELFEAAMKNQTDSKLRLEQYTKARITELMAQLNQVPLINRK